MSTYGDAAEALRRELVRLESLSKAAEFLGCLESLEQTENEVRARMQTAREQEAKLQRDLQALQQEVEVAASEARAARQRAQQTAKDVIARANEKAEGILAAARDEAERRIQAVKKRQTEVEERSRRIAAAVRSAA